MPPFPPKPPPTSQTVAMVAMEREGWDFLLPWKQVGVSYRCLVAAVFTQASELRLMFLCSDDLKASECRGGGTGCSGLDLQMSP